MDTNFKMMKALEKTYCSKEHTFGILTVEEVSLISSTFCLEERSLLDLRNLRDFIVLYYSLGSTEDIMTEHRRMDELSAITYVIDNMIVTRYGAEV